jgi:hypothetical protein
MTMIFTFNHIFVTGGQSTFFKYLTVGDKLRMEIGFTASMKITSRNTVGGKNAPKIFGTVTGFEVLSKLPDNVETYYGDGNVRYIREPKEIFGGEKDEGTSLNAMDWTSRDTMAVRVKF